MLNRTLFSFSILLLLSWHQLAGQTTISGKVTEKGTGEALPYANVIIKGSKTGVVTNLDGFFSLIDVKEKELILVISYVGFTTLEVVVKDEKYLKIQLEPLSDQLEEVVVTANSYKVFDATTGISTTILSTKQISLLPSIGEPDIFRSLQMLPGVSSTNENSSGLFIRGGTPDQNLTLLDGMTVYKVDHFFGFFSAFNTNVVKDVRLYRGAFPARYGGRTSGVIELTGKTGSFEKVQGGVNLSLLSIGGNLEIPISKKLSVLIAGRRSYSEVLKGGLYKDLISNLNGDSNLTAAGLENATNITTEPDFYFYDWNSKLSYRPGERDLITISTYSGQDFLDESQNLLIPVTDQVAVDYFLDETTDWGNRGVSTKWSRQWNPKVYTNLLFAGSEYFSSYQRDEQLIIFREDSIVLDGRRQTFEDNSVIDLSMRADLEWQLNLNTKFEFGVSTTENKVEYDNIRDDTVTLLNRSQRARYSSMYASQESKIGDKLKLLAGVRLSSYELSGGLLFEPRLNLNYDLTEKIKLKTAFGIHYQFANQIVNQNISEGSREFWLLSDGELIELSKSIHYVAGISYKTNGWLFDMETFYKDLEGITEFSLQFQRGINDSVNELFRSGNGFASGMELLIQKTQGKYTGWISYTLSDIRNTISELNNGFAYRPLHYQRHEFKMVHSVEVDDWTLSSNFIYGSGNPFSEPSNRYQIELLDGRTLEYVGLGVRNGSFNPAYIRLDLSANYDFDMGKAKARLGLSLFNLLGRRNVWYTEYNFSQSPPLINQINYLGFTPNLLFSLNF
ncbi:MAG: TonB-dependent receptor [Bacteroidota bacterium]